MKKKREHTKLQFKQKATEIFSEWIKNRNRTKKLSRHLRGNERDVRKLRGVQLYNFVLEFTRTKNSNNTLA
jgi:hypothetical protein